MLYGISLFKNYTDIQMSEDIYKQFYPEIRKKWNKLFNKIENEYVIVSQHIKIFFNMMQLYYALKMEKRSFVEMVTMFLET